MKKYKLIKEYPGSPELHTEVVKNGTGYDRINKSGPLKNWVIPVDIEKYNEYWQEIIEKKDYEILGFIYPNGGVYPRIKRNDGLFYFPEHCINQSSVTEKYCLQMWNIHSVKRLSDGEIFKINDDVTFLKNQYRIIKFDIFDTNASNKIVVTVDDTMHIGNQYRYELNSIQHFKQPLFKTEDGVDIFEGDKYFSVGIKNVNNLFKIAGPYINPQATNPTGDILYFSTKQAAEEYITMNKPVISLRDCLDIYFDRGNFEDKIKSFAKNKTKT